MPGMDVHLQYFFFFFFLLFVARVGTIISQAGFPLNMQIVQQNTVIGNAKMSEILSKIANEFSLSHEGIFEMF